MFDLFLIDDGLDEHEGIRLEHELETRSSFWSVPDHGPSPVACSLTTLQFTCTNSIHVKFDRIASQNW